MSFEPCCINCLLGYRGGDKNKQTVGSNAFSCCFIRIFLLQFHRAPFWTSDVLLACCSVSTGTCALILTVLILCHAASALPCPLFLPLHCLAILDWRGPHSLWCQQRRAALCEASGTTLSAHWTGSVLWTYCCIHMLHTVLILEMFMWYLEQPCRGRSSTLARKSFRCNQTVNFNAIWWV